MVIEFKLATSFSMAVGNIPSTSALIRSSKSGLMKWGSQQVDRQDSRDSSEVYRSDKVFSSLDMCTRLTCSRDPEAMSAMVVRFFALSLLLFKKSEEKEKKRSEGGAFSIRSRSPLLMSLDIPSILLTHSFIDFKSSFVAAVPSALADDPFPDLLLELDVKEVVELAVVVAVEDGLADDSEVDTFDSLDLTSSNCSFE